jgi:hypothetical protein
MARKITAVLAPKPGQGATLDVPQDVKDEIDQLFDHLMANPGQEGFAEFDDAKEKREWLRQVRSYAISREAGALKFRQLPSKHLPDNQVRFSLARDIPADGARASQDGPVSPETATAKASKGKSKK